MARYADTFHEGRIFPKEDLGTFEYDHVAMRCPVCGHGNVHYEESPIYDAANDLCVQLWGECGHRWNLGFRFHKGITILFWQRDAVREALLLEEEYGA